MKVYELNGRKWKESTRFVNSKSAIREKPAYHRGVVGLVKMKVIN